MQMHTRFTPLFATVSVAALLLLLTSCRQANDDRSIVPDDPPATEQQVPTATSNEADPPSGLAVGDHTFSFRHDGRRRSYIVHVPPRSTGPLPVLVALHGGGGTGSQFQEENGVDAIADREGFLAVYPEGTGVLPNRLHTWNSGDTCCGFALDRDIDDVGFLQEVLADLFDRVEVDPGRIYMTGHSNGGMMAYRFAAEAPELVTAIASVGGAIDVNVTELSPPVALLHIHSVDDPRALYGGGEGPPFPGTDRTVNHVAVVPGIASWASANGCARGAERGDIETGTGENDGQSAFVLTWPNCDGDSAVEHLVLSGSGHGWPGVTAPPVWQHLLGDPTTIINASEEVWAFVSQFDR